MDTNQIMVDIETLGTSSNAFIIQIGACVFNISTGEILSQFNMCTDLSKESEIKIEGSILDWWISDPTRLSTLSNLFKNTDGKLSNKDLMEEFYHWILKVQGIYMIKNMWGNGTTFDNVIIKNSFIKYGLCYPIGYRNDMDMRTIIALASDISGEESQDFVKRNCLPEDQLTNHNALSDAINQAHVVTCAYNIIKHGGR